MSLVTFSTGRARGYALFAMILLGLCMSLQRSSAQPFAERFQRYEVQDGLSDYTILSILQDAQGFLWFGTQNGLNRFDGHTFKVYKQDPTDSTSLSGNRIQALYQSADSTLWVGTFTKGLNRFDRAREGFVRYDLHEAVGLPNDGSRRPVTIQTLTEDRAGQMWIGTNYGLLVLDPGTDTFTHFKHDPRDRYSLSSDSVNVVLEDRRGLIWIGTTGKGVNCFDPQTGRFERYRLEQGEDGSGGPNDVRAIIEDYQGMLWIGSMSGTLHRVDAERRRFDRLPGGGPATEGHAIYSLYEDRAGSLWVGTQDDGVWHYRPEEAVFKHYRHEPQHPQSLSHNQVNAFYEDRSGQMWIGTWGGLNKLASLSAAFVHYASTPERPNTLNHPRVVAIYEDRRDAIWIGTWGGGLDRFDPQSGQFTSYTHDAADANSVASNNVFALAEDQSGRLWVGTLGGGISVLDPGTGRFTSYTHDSKDSTSLSDDRVIALLQDRRGGMWIGTTTGGLNRFDPQTDSFTKFLHDPDRPESLGSNHVPAIYEDRQGVLWIGTADAGLNRFDRAQGHFTRFMNTSPDSTTIQGTAVNAIREDQDGALWIGTDSGLNRLDPTRSRFTAYTREEGLPNETILGILIDDDGTLWLGTNGGLVRFDPQTEKFIAYTTKDGVQSMTFHRGAYLKSRSGRFYMGGANGFNAFDPRAIPLNTYQPPVVLTAFGIHTQPYLDQAANTLQAVKLDYKQNYFTFTFAALDFTDPPQNQYRVKLEDYDQAWIELGTRRTTNYTRVSPGTYTLRVQGSNNEGIWSQKELTIAIDIKPPFWATWWFRTLVVVFVVGVMAAAYRLRIRTLERFQELRTRIAGQLHDNVGANLSAIALKSEGMLEDPSIDERGVVKLNDIVRLARTSASAIRETSWVVNTGYDQLDKLVVALKDLAADMLTDTLTYTFTAPPTLRPDRVSMDFRQNVYYLYKEVLHNIVKHAEATRVTVEVTHENRTLSIQVTDDGVGFMAGEDTSGNGMLLMQKRADELKGTLTLESEPGNGTSVMLRVPIN